MHQEEGPGDVLVFLTGQEEIDSLERLISDRAAVLPPSRSKLKLDVVVIYAAMPPEQQMKVRPTKRQICCQAPAVTPLYGIVFIMGVYSRVHRSTLLR